MQKVRYLSTANIQMKHLTITIFVLSSILSFVKINAQSDHETLTVPTFEPFKGKVYSMPIVEKKIGNRISKKIIDRYTDDIESYPVLGDIELEEINIPESNIALKSFPQVERKTQFCMILHSTMTIHQKACYEFSLHSDDGSVLWINQEMYIDNDGGHQMQLKKDTFQFDPGTYDIKLWYFQGLPDRFGFVFKSKMVPSNECDAKVIIEEIDVNTTLLFETGKYSLNAEAISYLSEIIKSIDLQSISSIEVIGHTDNVGSENDNLILSEKRAQAITKALHQIIDNRHITIRSKGKGESEPKSSNETEQGRKENRRVNIRFVK